MNAQLHRALVAFTGMPDERENTTDVDYRSAMVSGDCEFLNSVPPDAERVIQPPKRTPEDHAYIARVRRWALYAGTAGMAALAGLLELFGAPPLLP